MNQLRRVLTTCENLQKLAVTCVPDHASNISGVGQSLLEPGLRLPHLRYLQLRGLQLAEHNFDGWEQCVMWESLEYLELSDTTFLQFFTPSLTNLISLTLSEPFPELVHDRMGLVNLIRQLPRLEHVVLNGHPLRIFGNDVLKHIAKPLRTLKLHDEVQPDSSVRFVPGHEYIRRLGETCRALETFAIDVMVEEAWVSAASKRFQI